MLVTALPNFLKFKDLVYIAKNKKDYSVKLRKALKDRNTSSERVKAKKRLKIAKDNSYDSRASEYLSYLDKINTKSQL